MAGEKKYKTVLADPPWPVRSGSKDFRGVHRGANRHYPLMKTREIIEYMQEIPFDENCHLYLWVTNNFLLDGLEVMKALGFRYVTNIVWVKDRFGLGQYFRSQHELLLFGVRGILPFKRTLTHGGATSVSTVIQAKRRKHSQKPTEQYIKIESTSYEPYLEVFARTYRDKWDSWGNQLPDTLESFGDDQAPPPQS